MKYISFFIFLLFALLIWNCEKTIQLDLDQTEPILVIDAMITNIEGHNYVRLTKSSPFYEKNATPRVAGAKVQIIGSDGEFINFTESTPGIYLPPTGFIGTVGQQYTLNIELDGQQYSATERMYPVNPFDSISYWKVPDLEDPEEDRFYEMLLYYTEPQDEENYYLFKFYRNQEELNYDGTEIYAYDDEALGESINGISTPDYYAVGDTGRAEVFSLSRKAFRYYTDLYNNLNNDGGIFSGIPANAGSNIIGNAIGYFQVSAMESVEIVIEP